MKCINFLIIILLIVSFAGMADSDERVLKVFVFAGQSNMVGKRCKTQKLPKELQGEQKNVLFFDGEKWVPFAAGKTEKKGFGPEISFMYRISQNIKEPIGAIKVSIGGTNLAKQWSPADKKSLYAKLAKQVKDGGKLRPIQVVGMLWMQGGRDAKFKEMAEAYAKNLDNLIKSARKDFKNPKMIFIAGRGNPPKKKCPYIELVSKAKTDCKLPGYAWVDCSGLDKFKDNVHYSEKGMVELGYRLADKYLKMIKLKPDKSKKGEGKTDPGKKEADAILPL